MVDRLHLGCSVNNDVEVRLLLLVLILYIKAKIKITSAARLTVDHLTSDENIGVRFFCSAVLRPNDKAGKCRITVIISVFQTDDASSILASCINIQLLYLNQERCRSQILG